MIDWMTQILFKRKDIDEIILAVDQGTDGWAGVDEVAVQLVAARLGHGSDWPELGVAHPMGHRFWRGLTLQMRHIQGNSHRGSSNGGGDRVGRTTPVGLLQPSAMSRMSSNGQPTTRLGYARMAMWCWLGVAGSPMEWRWARVVARVSTFADRNSS
jgi:hypothetical protein